MLGDWTFHPAAAEVRRGPDRRRLENRAARVLELLCERRGEVVARVHVLGGDGLLAPVEREVARVAQGVAGGPVHRVQHHADDLRLVLVDADPLEMDARQLRSMPVAHTLMAGRPTFGPAVAAQRDAATA